MSNDVKKRDRALQRRVRERMAKTGESYQAAWRQLTGSEAPAEEEPEPPQATNAEDVGKLLAAWQHIVVAPMKDGPPQTWAQTAEGSPKTSADRLLLALQRLPRVLPHQPTRVTARAKESGDGGSHGFDEKQILVEGRVRVTRADWEAPL
jgi:hypothetical protein